MMPDYQREDYDKPLPLDKPQFYAFSTTSIHYLPESTMTLPTDAMFSFSRENHAIHHRISFTSTDSRSGSTNSGSIIPGRYDVLLGRGGKNNQHVGNAWLRKLANQVSQEYGSASKREKSRLSRLLVNQVRDKGGRFLKFNKCTEQWEDVGDEQGREKTSQTLRDAVSLKHAPNRTISGQSLDDITIVMSTPRHQYVVSDASVTGSSSSTGFYHERSPFRPPSTIEFVTMDYSPSPAAKRRRTSPQHHVVVEDGDHDFVCLLNDLDPIPLESVHRADAVRRVSEVGSSNAIHHANWDTFDALEFDLFEAELLASSQGGGLTTGVF